jgi:hypothetical protein
MSTKPKIKKVCALCCSEDVAADATARWNVETQEWEMSDLTDTFCCDNCCSECMLREVEVEVGDDALLKPYKVTLTKTTRFEVELNALTADDAAELAQEAVEDGFADELTSNVEVEDTVPAE